VDLWAGATLWISLGGRHRIVLGTQSMGGYSHVRYFWSYIAASTLVFYLHYFFSIIFLTHLAYLIYSSLFERRDVCWRRVVAGYCVIGILVAPLWPHVRLLLHEAHTLPFAPRPEVAAFVSFVAPSMVIFGLFVSALVVQFLFPDFLRRPQALSRGFFMLLFAWWLLGPAVFFGVSFSTPMRVFLPRYLAFSLPAQALLLAYMGYSIFGALGGRIWALIAVLLSTGVQSVSLPAEVSDPKSSCPS